ncbi:MULTISPECIES: DUF3102 domain-containing protein [unclassified Bradyrhizobium]|uniref:DUF3102 domain-containing protein n=1 Tax=unclassified Bradyrhizobium TaxID=2631580 RepID=UPI0028E43BCB|nr:MULTISPECIES: DUF3102 domain-containing protein [unclassified Bradyrhizobium]
MAMSPNGILSIQQQPEEAPGFDYNSIQPSVAKFLKGQALRIRQYCAKSVIQIGKDLVAAKHYLSHGEFIRWVEYEVGIPARTAQVYMRAASWASSKSASVALLPPTALYVLSSPGLPKEFVDKVLRQVEAGERIHLQALRAQIKALREVAARQAENGVHNRSDEGPDSTPEEQQAPVTTAMLSNAVRILARALSATEFALVRNIITSKPVLQDPDLPRILESVFSSVERESDEPNSASVISV